MQNRTPNSKDINIQECSPVLATDCTYFLQVSSLIETYLTQMCYRLFLLLDPEFSMQYFSESNTDEALQAVGVSSLKA